MKPGKNDVSGAYYSDALLNAPDSLRKLPFVTSANHLGHELSQDCTMELDAKIKRADFIDKTVNIQETFSFALPKQVIQAIDKYCGDHYGGMLWSFDGQGAGQYFRCWHAV